ncbi:MAG: hypothetical protein ACXVWV_11315 [Nocardioides sp.]
MRTSLAALLVVLLAAAGCSDPRTALEDEAACPGATCTQDAQARYDAIAALAGVTEVTRVSRSTGLDRGTTAHAEVVAHVADRRSAHQVALAVLGELDAWPDRHFSVAEVSVVADPPVQVDATARAVEDLTNPHFRPCRPDRCRQAVGDLRRRLLAEVDGLQQVDVRLRGSSLLVSGRTDAAHAELAAAGARRLVFDTALRLGDRLEVAMTARGPLALTLRLQDGLVCEQPPGTTTACDRSDAVPFGAS